MSKVIVVGGGAAGMMAAVFAAGKNGIMFRFMRKMTDWAGNYL